jgi:hypothetical protein
LSIYDIQGRVVKKQEFKDNSYILNTRLDVSSFASGIYFLKINQGAKYYTQKINIK